MNNIPSQLNKILIRLQSVSSYLSTERFVSKSSAVFRSWNTRRPGPATAVTLAAISRSCPQPQCSHLPTVQEFWSSDFLPAYSPLLPGYTRRCRNVTWWPGACRPQSVRPSLVFRLPCSCNQRQPAGNTLYAASLHDKGYCYMANTYSSA